MILKIINQKYFFSLFQICNDQHLKTEQQLLKDKIKLQEVLHLNQKENLEATQNINLRQAEKAEIARMEFEEMVLEMERKYSFRYAQLIENFSTRLKNEISQTEENKNIQIREMKKEHDRNCADIKNYYNDITLNNIGMIGILKDEIKEKQIKFEKTEHQLNQLQIENKNLIGPLKKSQNSSFGTSKIDRITRKGQSN